MPTVSPKPVNNKLVSYTCESVCAGHPDKIADQISDALLDAVLTQDPRGRTAIETLVTKNQVVLAGEINTQATIDFDRIIRQVILDLGYNQDLYQFNADSLQITNLIHQQSAHIAQGVDQDGAGDQGLMIGYACNETDQYLPLPLVLSHQLTKRLDQARINQEIDYLRPDGKAQVSISYHGDKPTRVNTIVLAAPHHPDVSHTQLTEDLTHKIITPLLQEYNLRDPHKIIINGTGLWHIGGPASDTGLTGRKIVVDSYGPFAPVGGGCFSGKDATKVDRSGAYAARYIAKNIVAAGLADRVQVSLAYAIGQPQPVMKQIETFGTANVILPILNSYVSQLLDTSVQGIIRHLSLTKPIYHSTATYGHFGNPDQSWEKIIPPQSATMSTP